MRELMRRLTKLEECAKSRIVDPRCICAEPIKTVVLEQGEPPPPVTACPAHPDRIRLIVMVMRGIDPVTRETRREVIEIIEGPTCAS